MAICLPSSAQTMVFDPSFSTSLQPAASTSSSPSSSSSPPSPSLSPSKGSSEGSVSPVITFTPVALSARRGSSQRSRTPCKLPLPSTEEVPEEDNEGSTTSPATTSTPLSAMPLSATSSLQERPGKSFTVRPVQRSIRNLRRTDASPDSHDTSEYDTDDPSNHLSSLSSSPDFGPGRGPFLLKDTPRRQTSEGEGAEQGRGSISSAFSTSLDDTDEDEVRNAQSVEDQNQRNSATDTSLSLGFGIDDTLLPTSQSREGIEASVSTSPPLDVASLKRRVDLLRKDVSGGRSDTVKQPDLLKSVDISRDASSSTSVSQEDDLADLANKIASLEVMVRKSTAALPPLPASSTLKKSYSSHSQTHRHSQDSSTSRRPQIQRLKSAETSRSTSMYSSNQAMASNSTVTGNPSEGPIPSGSSSYAPSSRRPSASSLASSTYSYSTHTTQTGATSVHEGGASGSEGDGEYEDCLSSSSQRRAATPVQRAREPQHQHQQHPSFSRLSPVPSHSSYPPPHASKSNLQDPRFRPRRIVFEGSTEVMLDDRDRVYVNWNGNFVPIQDFFTSPPPSASAPNLTIYKSPSRSTSFASADSGSSTISATHGGARGGGEGSSIHSSLSSESGSGEHGHGSGSGGLHSRSLAGYQMAIPTKAIVEKREAVKEREDRIKLERAKMGIVGKPKMKAGPGRGRMVVKTPKNTTP